MPLFFNTIFSLVSSEFSELGMVFVERERERERELRIYLIHYN